MARPRKTLTDDQIKELETLNSDWSKTGPIVYGLAANDGVIVYVGATRNPKRRFAHYRINRNCHNKKLQEWLRRQGCVYVHILHKGETELFKAENREIKNRLGLFNMIAGGEQSWRVNSDKPWMAGTGILCPSSLALRMMAMNKHKDHKECALKVKNLKNKMSDQQRIIYEVNLAKLMDYDNRVKKWLSLTTDRMLKVLMSDCNV